MVKNTASSDSATRRLVACAPYVCAIAVFALLCLRLSGGPSGFKAWSFWDAKTYANTIQLERAGADPYSENGRLRFVYPPIFVHAAESAAGVLPHKAGWTIYIGLLCLATCAVSWAITTGFLRSEWLTAPMAIALFVLQPQLFAEIALMSGNVAMLLYAPILIAAIPGIRRNRWRWFYVAVAIAALVKPPYLTMLLLPLLIGSRQIWQIVATSFLVCAGYIAQWSANPTLFVGFMHSVHSQIVTGGDIGIGFLWLLSKAGTRLRWLQNAGPVYGSLIMIAGLVVSFFLLRRVRDVPAVSALWAPAVLVTAIISNPRMLSYDADVAVVPAIYLFVEWARGLGPSQFRGVQIVTPPAAFVVLYIKMPFVAIFLVLLGSVLLTLLRVVRIYREVSQQDRLLRSVRHSGA
jgi:hypothetical protein